MCKINAASIIKSISTLILFGLMLSCGGDSGPSGPAVVIVPMTGSLEFVDDEGLEMSDITIVLGESSTNPDNDGDFSIGGNKMVPGLATAYDETDTTILLMAIVPHPVAGGRITLDVHSTAIALVYMHPLVAAGGDYQTAVEVINKIDSLPQLTTLENLLESKLTTDPKALGKEDSQIANAIMNTVGAYIDSYPDYIAGKLRQTLPGVPKQTAVAEDDGGIGIIPTTQVSGHMLQYMGKDKFKITNAYGRWACMHIPRDNKKFYLSPNGSMMDFIKDGRPWAPSEHTFTMPVSHEEDTVLVNVYGYGLSGAAENNFANLTHDEKMMTHDAGFLTFLFEFIGNVVSVVTNTLNGLESVDGYEDIVYDKGEVFVMEVLLSDAPFVAQVELLYSQEQYWDMAWMIFKKIFEKVMSTEFLQKIAIKIAGKALNDKQANAINALMVSPGFRAAVTGVAVGNKVTNVMKTVCGFGDAQLKTTFKVWRDTGEFGDVSGYVIQKDHPYGPIEGAKVVLGGDENNPLPSHVTQWNTDADGGFLFADCLIGTKTITASMPGYKTETVEVVILDDQEVKVTIELEYKKGIIKGLIVNDIKSKWRAHPRGNSNQDTLFTREANLRVTGMVNGELYERSYGISNGRFELELPVSTFWVVASHENYITDSVQITVIEDETTNLSRPLLMKAFSKMWANNTYVTDYSGSPFDINFGIVACSPVISDYTGSAMFIAGGINTEPKQEFDILLNVDKVRESGFYDIAYGYKEFPYKKGVLVNYLTNLIPCEGSGGTKTFTIYGVPGYDECDCNIEYPGNVIFTKYSNTIGDAIEGKVLCKLSGWKDCDCDSVDTNGDMINDAIEVDCQIADMDITFETVVGADFWLMQGLFGADPFKPGDSISALAGRPLLLKDL